ncbi:MAG: Metallo-beta-lactamase superfamily protein [Frankiales bacterium]|nr:Metallo-beta-lactamase superfamily protein [Frankiales bacterium]
MLTQVARGVLVHTSEFCRSNAVVVQGADGVLVIDPGVLEGELTCLASDIRELGQPVAAGFSTHPHWDHLLWHRELGDAPRHITAVGEGTVRARLSDDGARARVATMLPPEFADRIPLDLLGLVTGLPADATEIPWDGPTIRIVEHQGHAPGHAALLIDDVGVLVAGDMLSDVLVPMLNLMGAPEPLDDYLAGLQLLENVARDVAVLIPGHGAVGGADDVRSRIDRDRAYVQALRADRDPSDPRVEAAEAGWEWVAGVHENQRRQLTGGS